MSDAVIRMGADELRARRERALADVGLDERSLERRVWSGRATDDELEAWHEVEAARFLLDHR